jgi:hypothetical protein
MGITDTLSGLNNLPQIVTAIGGLGTAAFGLVDATKPFFGGVNNIGFSRIATAVSALTPSGGSNALPGPKVIDTLKANWFNGADLASQKAIAKSLIKLNLNEANAPNLASITGVDGAVLKQVAASIASGTALTTTQSDVFARFDLSVTALLDEAYQRSDEMYRNGTKVVAMIFAILLALGGSIMLHGNLTPHDLGKALIVGILATPLAPVAKDLSTALATAVNALQAVKK